ncbi:MAG: amino acid ABC transporter substrate-binding protein [Burkholderiales bacterium]
MRIKFIIATAMLVLVNTVLADDISGTLKKIKDTGVIKLGFLPESIPFSFEGAGGKPMGYSTELCTRVATGIQEQLGLPKLDVEWVPITLQSRFEAVKSGTIDLECGITSNTLSRQKQVDFSLMIWVDGANFLVRDDSPFKTLGDLNGKRIAVIPGTTTVAALSEALAKSYIKAEILTVQTHVAGLEALSKGNAEAYASDQTVLIGLALAAAKSLKVRLGDGNLSYEPYGLMMRRNDQDFRQAVNAVLARLYRTGQIAPIYDRWFGKLGKASQFITVMYLLNGLPE